MNPLHYTGPISVLLFVVVFATGLYLTMFYRFGFEASYESVADIEASLAGRFIRAAHRYGSIALVVTSVLHGWRTFVMDRFRGPRRLAWLTGVASVALVWIVGVTGYWLIWDERVEFLNETLTRVLAPVPAGLDFLLDFVLTDAAGTGWPFLLLLFLLHVGISTAVAVLIWVHIKRLARPQWLPPAFWAALVGGSLLVMSLTWPVGMLEPLDPATLPAAIPLDPFFLFLLPGGLSWPPGLLWGGAIVLLVAFLFLPWYVRRRRPPAIQVDPDRCTGCRLCVPDCPYDALHMVDLEDTLHPHLAVVTDDKCVGCGICVGACPVNALHFPDRSTDDLWAEVEALSRASDRVLLVCERHDPVPGAVTVPCIGMLHPDLIGGATEAGAAIQVIGCPPGDCASREGSRTLAGRLSRTRLPRLRRRYRDAPISADWIGPAQVAAALVSPGMQPDASLAPESRQLLTRASLPLVGLVVATAVATVLATGLRFDPGGAEGARLEVTLDHRAGVPLEGFGDDAAAPSGAAPRLVIESDGATLFDGVIETVDADEPDTALYFGKFELGPGLHTIRITLFDEPTRPQVLFDDSVALDAGEAVVLNYWDVPVVDPISAGRAIFNETALGTSAGCRICHSLEPGRDLVGPSLAGLASRAGTTVPGLTGADYVRQSIVEPDAYVVPGYPAGQMLANLGDALSDRELGHLVAFLLTLTDER